MKSNIKKFKDKLNENIDVIPLDDLGVIVQNKNLNYLNKLKYGVDQELFDSIKDILWGVDYSKNGYLMHGLYMSTLLFHFKDNEECYHDSKIFRLRLVLKTILEGELLKLNFNLIMRFNRDVNNKCLGVVQSSIKARIKSKFKVIKSYLDDLGLLLEVLDGVRMEFELYRSKEDLELLKNTYPELYNIMINEIYCNETLKIELDDDEYMKSLLKDVVSGEYFKRRNSYYLVNFENLD